MKKITTILAMTLLLAACGDKQTEDAAPQPLKSTTETQSKSATSKNVVQEESVVLYNHFYDTDDHVSKGESVPYVYKRDGSLTQFLLKNLEYNQYVKAYSVSKNEKVVMLNFKASVMKTSLFQGSTGATQTREAIGKTFFANMPKLKTLKFRLNGKQEEWDHMNFTDYSRKDFKLN